MDQKLSTIAGVLTCLVTLWTAGIPEASRAAAARAENTLPNVSASEPDGAAQAITRSTSGNPLAGTNWLLVEFQSMDDATGTVRPDDPSGYTMRLDNDGTVTMRLNCNRAAGTWTAEPSSDGTSGRITFGPLAATRARCPPPSMDEHIVAQAEFIRSYLLKDGRLYLSLMADGGIYAWEPNSGEQDFAEPPPSPEDGGPRNWVVTGISSPLNLREHPSTGASVVATFAPGTILDNLGCQRAEGRIWCDVQQLGGGGRAAT